MEMDEAEEFKKTMTSFETIQIGDLLKNSVFIVPPNQRIYSWKKDNWQELWEDLLSVVNQRKLASHSPHELYHFFGPMFFIPEEENGNQYRIIDGQQRLATTSILLTVLLDLLDLIRDKGKISSEGVIIPGIIEERLFKRSSGKRSNRILLGKSNKELYQKIIEWRKAPAEKIKDLKILASSQSNKELLKCYKFFLNAIILYLREKKSSGADLRGVDTESLDKIIKEEPTQEFLIAVYESAVEGLYVLKTEVPAVDIAYEMFETLNQRGEQLLTVDLFKNYLFDKFGKAVNIKKIETFWDELVTIAGEEKKLKTFIRHFWLANFEFAREKNLFKAIRKEIEGRVISATKIVDEFNKFSAQLLKEAAIYFALRDPNNAMWRGKDDIAQILDEIKYLGFLQPLPLILAAHIKLFEKQPKKFKQLIETYLNFAVRKYTIMGENPNELACERETPVF